MMLDRNSLSHIYDEETSRKIYDNIRKNHIINFKKLEEKLRFNI